MRPGAVHAELLLLLLLLLLTGGPGAIAVGANVEEIEVERVLEGTGFAAKTGLLPIAPANTC